MKKNLLFACLLFVCCLLLDSQRVFTSILAQNETSVGGDAIPVSAAQSRAADRALAQTIRRLTNRSSEGLVERKIPSGGFSIDLEERFQNVMLARLESDGEPTAACVTSIEEANEFFGKDLETGELIFSNLFRRDDAETVAARHGMSRQEFEFYTNLIENGAIGQTESPVAATINIFNGDGAGEGFNDTTAASPEGGNNGTTLGAQRLNLFNEAARIWGAFLDSSVTTTVNSKFDPLTCTSTSATLGSAGATNVYRDFTGAAFPGTWHHTALTNKLNGSDPNGTAAEINATFNSNLNGSAGCLGGRRFYLGFDNTTPTGTTNLLVVLLHELGHGLGFSSFASGSTGALLSGFPDVYTRYMYDRSTSKYWYQMTDAERQTSALNSGNVFWDGANVRIASGFLTAGRETTTGRVQLYTPTTFSGGSSISHFDISAATNLLMEPSINTGLPLTLDLTRQQMRDIGWYRDTNADRTPDTITNVTPNGGTTTVGNNVNITWTNTDGFNRNVTIELSTDGGASYPTTIASNVANTGSFTWTIPNTVTQQARVRVREYDFVAPLGISSANFGIGLAPTAANASVSGRVAGAGGRGISGARVNLTDSNGNEQLTQSNAFGYFRFQDVPVGTTYFVSVKHKQYRFLPQTLNLNEAVELNFTPSNR